LLGANSNDAVVFAFNGTDALNIAMKSIVRSGDHVVTTCMDHNSVLRPLSALEQRSGITWSATPADPRTTLVDPREIERRITPKTRLVVVNHASNVTGALQPILQIGEICRKRDVLFLVDAAQTAGHVPIDFSKLPVDLLALPGHKGLLGPLGTGVLVIRQGLEGRLQSVREGGTGSQSESPTQPTELPDLLESGSHNAVGIAGLNASLNYLNERGVAAIHEQETELTRLAIDSFERIEGLTLYGPPSVENRVGVLSIRIEGIEPAELSALLETQFELLTRSGLHCAPLAHQTLGTATGGGTTRISFGPFNTGADVNALADALAKIAAQAAEFA
jgi:cysteine desulfurase family protein